jgi:hypothetical protein
MGGYFVPMPPCRCRERREAINRMKSARARGDDDTAQAEWRFVKSSFAEDTASYREWALARAAHFASLPKGSN